MKRKIKKLSEREFVKKLKKTYSKKRDHKETRSDKDVFDNAVISWEAQEFIRPDKSLVWFVFAGLIATGLMIYSIRQGSYSFLAAVAASVFAYVIYMRQKPKKIKVSICEIGIKLGRHKIPFSHIRAFWIIYHAPFIKTLNFRVADVLMPDVTIQLEDEDPARIREYLAGQIPEWEGKQENFFDSLTRFLKL